MVDKTNWDDVTIVPHKDGVLCGYTSELEDDSLLDIYEMYKISEMMPAMPKMPSKWSNLNFWIRKNILCRLGKHNRMMLIEVEYQNLWLQNYACSRCDETWEDTKLKQIKLVSKYDLKNN